MLLYSHQFVQKERKEEKGNIDQPVVTIFLVNVRNVSLFYTVTLQQSQFLWNYVNPQNWDPALTVIRKWPIRVEYRFTDSYSVTGLSEPCETTTTPSSPRPTPSILRTPCSRKEEKSARLPRKMTAEHLKQLRQWSSHTALHKSGVFPIALFSTIKWPLLVTFRGRPVLKQKPVWQPG